MFPGNLGPPEMMVIMVLAVLLFGKRLPEVGRSLGRGITEFKRGLRGEDDLPTSSANVASYPASNATASLPHDGYQAPKFEPPSAPPVIEATQDSAAGDLR